MNSAAKPRGPWIHRFSIHLFTVIFTLLVYWLLGFLVEDIGSIPGPQYEDVEARYVDPSLLERNDRLSSEIQDLERAIANKRSEMQIVSDSAANLQQTINQLIELQKQAVQNATALSETEQHDFSESLAHFLDSQKQYQERSRQLSELADRRHSLESERLELAKQIEKQKEPAHTEYLRLHERHQLRIGMLQLMILVPLLVIGAVLLLKKRDSLYFPLFLGYGAATLIKVGVVIHAYLPTRYVRYVLVLALLAVVVRLLIHFIRQVAFPKVQWLTQQYREAYERFLCPVCEYPIRTGPRKFLFWTRRTVNKIVLPREPAEPDQPYTCPSCGTVLFEECPQCHEIRHSLLPFCEHCGTEKPLGESV